MSAPSSGGKRDQCPACVINPQRAHTDAELREFHRGAFLVTGAGGDTIPVDEFFLSPKAHPRRMMLNSLSSDARRVYACLELHTVGFQQELAVKLVNGARINLTPADISRETGLSKHQVRKAMVELEEAGLGKREGDPEKGLRNGSIRLYAWAFPHPTANIKKGVARGYLPLWFPKESAPGIAALAKQKKYTIPDTVAARDYLLAHAPEAERAYQKGLEEGIALLDRVCALAETGAHIERTERTSERTAGAAAASQVSIDSEESSSSSFPEPTTTSAGDEARAKFQSEYEAHLKSEPPAISTFRSQEWLDQQTQHDAIAEEVLATPKPERMPDAKFSEELTRIFIKAGKDNPTRKQMRETRDALIDDPLAPAEFLKTLQSKIQRVKHPGALPEIVAGFNDKWPQVREILEANPPRAGEDPADRLARLKRRYSEAPADEQAMYEFAYPDIKFEKAMAAGKETLSPFERAEKESRHGKK